MSTIFIGDIHGCAQELEQLLDEAGYAQSDDRLLLTGDAFSRGPLPLRVWEIIGETGAEMVLGNHDDRLMRQLRQKLQGEEAAVSWKNQVSTLEQLSSVAEPLLNWLEQVPLCLDEDDFLLVHAGINPVAGVRGTSRQEFLTIRTWPPVEGVVGPRWHDAIEAGSSVHPLVIFGHDAPGGLVVKKADGEDRPYLLGLDSGCAHGNALSAYILEENRVVQVASRQPSRH
jgi:hypothetical protein